MMNCLIIFSTLILYASAFTNHSVITQGLENSYVELTFFYENQLYALLGFQNGTTGSKPSLIRFDSKYKQESQIYFSTSCVTNQCELNIDYANIQNNLAYFGTYYDGKYVVYVVDLDSMTLQTTKSLPSDEKPTNWINYSDEIVLTVLESSKTLDLFIQKLNLNNLTYDGGNYHTKPTLIEHLYGYGNSKLNSFFACGFNGNDSYYFVFDVDSFKQTSNFPIYVCYPFYNVVGDPNQVIIAIPTDGDDDLQMVMIDISQDITLTSFVNISQFPTWFGEPTYVSSTTKYSFLGNSKDDDYSTILQLDVEGYPIVTLYDQITLNNWGFNPTTQAQSIFSGIDEINNVVAVPLSINNGQLDVGGILVAQF